MITQEELKKIFIYSDDIGCFFRIKNKTFNSGFIDKDGYVVFTVNYKKYFAHRLAWLYFYGDFPKFQIDHINGIKIDNRICNLRLATNSENARNRGKTKINTSGHKGVYWNKNANKWQASICVNYKLMHLGLFDCKQDAINMYQKNSIILHKEFSNY